MRRERRKKGNPRPPLPAKDWDALEPEERLRLARLEKQWRKLKELLGPDEALKLIRKGYDL